MCVLGGCSPQKLARPPFHAAKGKQECTLVDGLISGLSTNHPPLLPTADADHSINCIQQRSESDPFMCALLKGKLHNNGRGHHTSPGIFPAQIYGASPQL